MNHTFDGVRDYIVAHYKLNTRRDSQYWLDNAANEDIPQNLSHLMEAWKSGKDFEQALHKISEQLVYLRPSWYCILAGMGIFPDQLKTVDKVAPTDQAIDFCAQVAKKYFIDHLTQLEKLNA